MSDEVISNADLVKTLKDLLKSGGDWESIPVSLKGNIEVVKLPANKKGTIPAKLGIKFNPLNKRKGTFFFEAKNYIAYLTNMKESAEGMLKLLKIAEKLNGTVARTTVRDGLKLF